MLGPSESGLSNNDGHTLAHQFLRPRLPHDLHDYIIEGLCKATSAPNLPRSIVTVLYSIMRRGWRPFGH